MNAWQVTVRGVSNVLVLYTGGTIGMIRSGKKGERNTNTRELTKSKMYRIKSECLENKQNLCRNQDGVLVTAPNALEQNLRRLVSKKNIIMGR